MVGGSNVDGDGSGGDSPSRQGAEIGTSGPPKLAGDGGGDRKPFWKKRLDIQGFRDREVNIGQGGSREVGPVTQAARGRGQGLAASPGHLDQWWPPSGSPSGSWGLPVS